MRRYLVLAIIMLASIVSYLPATNNNQASRQVQRATRNRNPPPAPISVGRVSSPQQNTGNTGPIRHSPRLAAQRQAQQQQQQGSYASIYPGTASTPATRGQIAQQRRLDRELQRGNHPITRGGGNRGVAGNTQIPQHGSHSTPTAAQQQTSQQPAISPTNQRTAQIGQTPLRQRVTPGHGLRELIPPRQQQQQGGHGHGHQTATSTRNTGQQATPGHRRPGSWVTIVNPPTRDSEGKIRQTSLKAGMKTPPKRE